MGSSQHDQSSLRRRWLVPACLGLFAASGGAWLLLLPQAHIDVVFYVGFACGLSAFMFVLCLVIEVAARRSQRCRKAFQDAVDRMAASDECWRPGEPGG